MCVCVVGGGGREGRGVPITIHALSMCLFFSLSLSLSLSFFFFAALYLVLFSGLILNHVFQLAELRTKVQERQEQLHTQQINIQRTIKQVPERVWWIYYSILSHFLPSDGRNRALANTPSACQGVYCEM